MNKIHFTGFNGFGQFGGMPNVITDLKEIDLEALNICNKEKICHQNISCCWEYNAIAVDRQLHILGCLNGHLSQSKAVTFEAKIIRVDSNEHLVLVLLENGLAYKLNLNKWEINKINQTVPDNADTPAKRIFPSSLKGSMAEEELLKNQEHISHIASGRSFSVAVTNKNHVYNIPMRIWTFPKHIKIKKVCCGNEHCLILTTNGDVYAFGSSSRGQLGLGRLDFEEKPELIEALAGIKIVDIATGGWHSAAVSSFGDLYMWGWNLNGQMGLSTSEIIDLKYESGRTETMSKKLPTVFATPQLINLPKTIPSPETDNESFDDLEDQYNVTKVYAGARHTIVEADTGAILGCGWNNYGQLGLHDIENDVVRFQKINFEAEPAKDVYVICGDWCTVFLTQT